MTQTFTTTIERGLCDLILADGRRITTEMTVTRIDDWRETSFGRANCGSVSFGPQRWVCVEDGAPCDPEVEMRLAEIADRRSRSPLGRLRAMLRL